MKAAIIYHYGDVDVLQYADIDRPIIKPDQMLVKVRASSINPIDWKIRQGRLKLLTGQNFPLVLGFDLAGDVVEIGDRITRFQVGDAIYARLNQLSGGAYAEYAAVTEQAAALKPTTMTYIEAAAVPLAAMTALQGLRNEGGLVKGQRVLVNGASGGVGTYAVQLAKILGAREVVGVCSAKNADLVKSLGADRVIDYQQQDFTQEATRYDIVFDVVGNCAFKGCKRVLQPQGTYVTTHSYPANYIQSLLTWFIPGQNYKVVLLKTNANDLVFLKEQIEAGKLRSVIDRTYLLSEIAAAHAYSETKRAVGKIVITVAQN